MRGRHTTNYTLYLFLCDLILTVLALYSAYEARVVLPWGGVLRPEDIIMPTWLYGVAVTLWAVIFTFLAVYDTSYTRRWLDEIQHLLVAEGAAGLTFAGTLYMTVRDVPRLLFVYFVMFHVLLLLVHRGALRLVFRYVGPQQRDTTRVLIVGTGPLAQKVAQHIRALHHTGMELVGCITDHTTKASSLQGVPILGRLQDIIRVIQHQRIDEVIIALPRHAQAGLVPLVHQLYTLPVRVRVVPDLLDLSISRGAVETLDGLLLVGLNESPIEGYYRLVKRFMDVILALAMLIVVSPLMALIALAIKVTSPDGPIIFKQLRVGENGRLFYMYKFRTMVPDAEARLDQVMRRLPDGTVIYKSEDDPRVLPLGRFLRKYSLDELPQLINVLKGDMSLVGPRPEIPQMLPYYHAWQWRRFTVPPGITGWWQINGRADKPMHLHTEYDLYYITHYSPLLDLRILWRTIGVVLRGRGAY